VRRSFYVSAVQTWTRAAIRATPGLLPDADWWRRPSLLIAVSGGLDSTVLLDLLNREARQRGDVRLGAAYLDHGWRGAEARLDGDFAAALCRGRGVPFFRAARDVRALARRRGLSLEDAGRRARYAFLARVARRQGFAAVATAHHAGDQAETLLLRLARGERGDGLAGIRSVTRLAGVEVVRPLLDVHPRDLLAYAEARALPFREDASNRDPRFPRNRLRPGAAARVNPADARAVTRLAALERRLLERAAERLEARPSWNGDPFGGLGEAGTAPAPWRARRHGLLPVAELAVLDPVLRREVLRRAHRRASGRCALPAGALAIVEGLLGAPAGGRADLPGARAVVSCGWLLFEPRPPAFDAPPATEERRFAWPRAGGAEPVELFDPAQIEGRLVLRTWQPGDRISVRRDSPERGDAPHGRKKLKEVFREARVPAWLRSRVPVLADDRDVLWVVGLRRAERARPRPGAPALRVRIGEVPLG
jgi:tRNA(Ile)-lysidine synthase